MLTLTANFDLYANRTLRRRLERLSDLPVDVAREVSIGIAKTLEQEAKANLQRQSARTLGRRTGNLLAHTRTEVRETPNGSTVELKTLFYGRVNARGAVIKAKNAPYLVFRIGGRLFKKKQVIIPARDWDRLAIERTRAKIPTLTRKAVIARMRVA